MKTCALTLFLITAVFCTYSQKPPIKFGKIDKSVLEMSVYIKDTTANAVIICDYGHFNSNTFQFTRILRIKILKKAGYLWANKVFVSHPQTQITGITYNLENELIVKEKLKSSSIFKERITDQYYNFRVAMPNVKVGSVIDLQFVFPLLPYEWLFQESIPIIWSELILEPSVYIDYRKNFFGYEPLAIATEGRWVAKDVPAFKTEPYINSVNNYISKFELEIKDVKIPGFYYKSYTTSWDAVRELLYEDEYFGGVIKGSAYLNDLAESINEKDLSGEGKIEAAFKVVKKIKWNGKNRLLASQNNLRNIYKKNIGNSADINLILLQLLRKLDIEADPVALSTRGNGILLNPGTHRLNHVIVQAKTNNKSILLDATDQYYPCGLLPRKCLNWRGRLFNEEKTEWVNLETDKKEKETLVLNLELNEDLDFVGYLMCASYDYASCNFRKKYYSYNSLDEFLEYLQKTKKGLQVVESDIDNLEDLYLPVNEKYKVEINNQVERVGKELYINPMLCEQFVANPFKLDERAYPVDFAYPIEKRINIIMKIPGKYKIVQLPEPAGMRMPDNSASFTYSISGVKNQINISFKLSVNKAVFMPEEYPLLKQLYNEIISKHSEPIILETI